MERQKWREVITDDNAMSDTRNVQYLATDHSDSLYYSKALNDE